MSFSAPTPEHIRAEAARVIIDALRRLRADGFSVEASLMGEITVCTDEDVRAIDTETLEVLG